MCKIAHCTAAEIAVQCEFNIKYLVMTCGETFSPHPQAGTLPFPPLRLSNLFTRIHLHYLLNKLNITVGIIINLTSLT